MITRYLTVIVTPLVVPAVAVAAAPKDVIKTGLCEASPDKAGCLNQGTGGLTGLFVNIINTIIFVIGAVSILMIVIGALRYTLSGGDPAGVKGAKDTILYAVIGLVVAAGAFAIARFVLEKL